MERSLSGIVETIYYSKTAYYFEIIHFEQSKLKKVHHFLFICSPPDLPGAGRRRLPDGQPHQPQLFAKHHEIQVCLKSKLLFFFCLEK